MQYYSRSIKTTTATRRKCRSRASVCFGGAEGIEKQETSPSLSRVFYAERAVLLGFSAAYTRASVVTHRWKGEEEEAAMESR